MSAFAGAQGYENLSSAQQQERSAANILDRGLARKPSVTPTQLSRVLYIPPHHNLEFHIGIYNVSAEYKHAIGHAPMGGSDIIGDALMGSRLFMTRLGTMKKPPIDIEDSKVHYAIDANIGANEVMVTVRSLLVGDQTQSIAISLPSSTDNYKINIDENMDVIASFPIPDTTSSAGTTQHPFFTFSTPYGIRKLQWQIHPRESGPLRYTLVEIDPVSKENDEDLLPRPDDIRAIYHHIGQSPSVSLCNCEGVLLLPADSLKDNSVMEKAAIASLLGLLWRVRGMQVKPPAVHSSQPKKKSFLERIFK